MRAPVSSKDLSKRLSARLANFKISDEIISKLADRVLIEELAIWRFDVCIYGICIDYFTDKIPKLDHVFKELDVATLEIFPYGIIDWDRFHVRVGYAVDGLQGIGRGRGFGH
jgi:hypothetical protein